MWSRLSSLIGGAVIAFVGLVSGCATTQPGKQYAVRQRFVPTTEATAHETTRGGASWTALVPLKDGTGVSRLTAHVGIGESFPVKDEEGRCFFEVKIAGGDDDHLVVVVNSIEGSRKFDLRRDKSVWVEIGGSKFDVAYPSFSVSAAKNEKPTTSQAMIMVHRHP